jgi:hypothetical protein
MFYSALRPDPAAQAQIDLMTDTKLRDLLYALSCSQRVRDLGYRVSERRDCPEKYPERNWEAHLGNPR